MPSKLQSHFYFQQKEVNIRMIILNEFCNLSAIEVFCLIFLVCLVLCFAALMFIAWKGGCNAGCGYETWENKHLEHVYYDIVAPITLAVLVFSVGTCFALLLYD